MSVQQNPFGPLFLALRPNPFERAERRPNEQSYIQPTGMQAGYGPGLVTATSMLSLVETQQLAAPFYSFTESSLMFDTTLTTPKLRIVSDVLSEIENLSAENEVAPTNFAYLRSRAVVETAYGLMLPKLQGSFFTPNIPMPVIVTDDVGGVRIVWRRNNKTVRANFGATQNHRSYLYFESNTEHAVLRLDAASLSERLKWLIKA